MKIQSKKPKLERPVEFLVDNSIYMPTTRPRSPQAGASHEPTGSMRQQLQDTSEDDSDLTAKLEEADAYKSPTQSEPSVSKNLSVAEKSYAKYDPLNIGKHVVKSTDHSSKDTSYYSEAIDDALNKREDIPPPLPLKNQRPAPAPRDELKASGGSEEDVPSYCARINNRYYLDRWIDYQRFYTENCNLQKNVGIQVAEKVTCKLVDQDNEIGNVKDQVRVCQ